METQTHITKRGDALFRLRLIQAAAAGTALFVLLAVLAVLGGPGISLTFITCGLAAGLLAALCLAVRRTTDPARLPALGYLVILVPALAVESTILGTGGHVSSHFAGLILLALCVTGFIPGTLKFHVIVAGLIYAVYLLPILVVGPITDTRLFLAHNFFLLSSLGACLILTYRCRPSRARELESPGAIEPGESAKLADAVDELVNEVAERKKMEAALTRAAEEWRATFDSAKELIMMVGEDLRIVKVNRTTLDFFDKSFEEILGQDCAAFFTREGMPEDLVSLGRMKRESAHREEEIHIPKRDIWVLTSLDPILDHRGMSAGFVLIIHDITDLKKVEAERQEMQSQLLQVQKMDSIGRLAGGVAHDFNNMLSAILAYSEMALMKLPEKDPVRRHVNIILSAAEKACSLTRQLLAFSRKQVLEKKVIDLGVTVDNMGKMLGRLIRADVRLEISSGGERVAILADPGQVEQVIMNLAVNARDAMPSGGTLTIRTGNALFDDRNPPPLKEMPAGAFAVLSVADTGDGILPEVREKMFEPFFTTKPEGKGTGLGLATVYGIVRQHDGWIDIVSSPNRGSTFDIYFPATGEGEDTEVEIEKRSLPGGNETILAVDDDEAIRWIIEDTLSPLGYQLLAAGSGEEAVELKKTYDRRIDVLLTDVMMPGMNGRDLARLFQERWPEVRIVLMSGYPDVVLEKHLLNQDGITFLEKPLTPAKLAAALREVLDR